MLMLSEQMETLQFLFVFGHKKAPHSFVFENEKGTVKETQVIFQKKMT